MDLVYPDDQATVMSAWNSLAQGSPVTFEMRWKPRMGSDDAAQWVLSACVPIFDDEGTLISIAGNTIDINAQKKSQEAAQARVEALERARLSEMKFARFAQLSPTAIFIFVPESGMYNEHSTLVVLCLYMLQACNLSVILSLLAHVSLADVTRAIGQRAILRADWALPCPCMPI